MERIDFDRQRIVPGEPALSGNHFWNGLVTRADGEFGYDIFNAVYNTGGIIVTVSKMGRALPAAAASTTPPAQAHGSLQPANAVAPGQPSGAAGMVN